MPAKMRIARGNLSEAKNHIKDFADGQLFWSYVWNNESKASNDKNHYYSEGQLFIKDPSSSKEFIEVANRRGLHAAVFRGYISESAILAFEDVTETENNAINRLYRNRINVDDSKNVEQFLQCKPGDFWIFEHDQWKDDVKIFNKGDILLATKVHTRSRKTEESFLEVNQYVYHVRIPGGGVSESSDLEVDTVVDAALALEQRVLYKGTFSSRDEFHIINRQERKKKGWTYVATGCFNIRNHDNNIWHYTYKDINIATEPPQFKKELVFEPEAEKDAAIHMDRGDFLSWDGERWIHIDSGIEAKDLKYVPNIEDVNSILTFDNWHVEEMSKVKNVKEAIDFLMKEKAGLDEKGKIPYSQLPDSIVHSMALQGVWKPVLDNNHPNDAQSQDGWPAPTPESLHGGYFWVVDTGDVSNVQYHDKWNPGRPPIELNSGDFIVWISPDDEINDTIHGDGVEGPHFDVIDNSDKISAITAVKKDGTEESLVGNVRFAIKYATGDKGGKDKVFLEVTNLPDPNNKNNSVKAITLNVSGLIGQDPQHLGQRGYFPIYKNETELTTGGLRELENSAKELYGTIVSDVGFQVGALHNPQNTTVYGNVVAHYTEGDSASSASNKSFDIVSKLIGKNNHSLQRTTQIQANTNNRFMDDDPEATLWQEFVQVYLPDISATLIGIATGAQFEKNGKLIDDHLTEHYLTKTLKHGLITDALSSEQLLENNAIPDEEKKVFADNAEEGWFNVGIGRTVSRDVDTGEITFWGKTADVDLDKVANASNGFYWQTHNIAAGYANDPNNPYFGKMIEHLLNRESKGKTHISINPSVLEKAIENWVVLPEEDGTLFTWEDWEIHVSEHGIPLMIPAWESMKFDTHKYVGLDTSPITIKINRPATGNTVPDRENYLNKQYNVEHGVDTSTWSYISSSQEGSQIDTERGVKDDVVTFDAWVEAQRAVASKEAFILPASAYEDDVNSTMDPYSLEVTQLEGTKPVVISYGKDKVGGKYQRIVPSGTLYRNSEQHFDPFTGQRLSQQHKNKDVEMPTVGGVILTDKSWITGGFWDDPNIRNKKSEDEE